LTNGRKKDIINGSKMIFRRLKLPKIIGMDEKSLMVEENTYDEII
jgi:hypothetical protein